MSWQTIALIGLGLATSLASHSAAQSPLKLKAALGDPVSDEWIYEDIQAGYAEAKKIGKPLLVSFR